MDARIITSLSVQEMLLVPPRVAPLYTQLLGREEGILEPRVQQESVCLEPSVGDPRTDDSVFGGVEGDTVHHKWSRSNDPWFHCTTFYLQAGCLTSLYVIAATQVSVLLI